MNTKAYSITTMDFSDFTRINQCETNSDFIKLFTDREDLVLFIYNGITHPANELEQENGYPPSFYLGDLYHGNTILVFSDLLIRIYRSYTEADVIDPDACPEQDEVIIETIPTKL